MVSHLMNTLLWVLQILGALMYAASGTMKVFMFDKISGDHSEPYREKPGPRSASSNYSASSD